MPITLENVSYFVGDKLIFDQIDFSVSVLPPERSAILGRNGAGKSTLLKIMSGALLADSGKQTINKQARVLLVNQELPLDDITPLDFLREQDKQLQALYITAESALPDEMEAIYGEIAHLETERYEVEAPRILSGLGIPVKKQNEPMSHLSGGLRMRVSLAAALVQQPDLLLLDEPTNHLDLPAVVWLTDYLRTYPAPFIMVSHDHHLLNAVITKIYHLHQGTLTCYPGNYDSFIEEFASRKELAEKINENLNSKHAVNQKFIDKFKAKPKWSKIAKTRERNMQRENDSRPKLLLETAPIPVKFPDCLPPNQILMELKNSSVGYSDNSPVLQKLNLAIPPNARIGILGCNGEGKSTLLKLLVGQLNAQSGESRKCSPLRIGYFSQDQKDVLDLQETVFLQMAHCMEHPTEKEIRSMLADFGFQHPQFNTAVGDLSGGEKTRLLLACIAARNPHLIILDEPTNHLDFETREMLVQAIRDFNGAVILVSHDQDLLQKTMNSWWLVKNGTVSRYTKDLEDYVRNNDAPSVIVPVNKMKGLTVLYPRPQPKEYKKEHPSSNHEKATVKSRKRYS